MTGPPSDEWTAVASAWTSMPTPVPPALVAADRRLSRLTVLEIGAGLLLVGLAVSAVLEHDGIIAWTVAGLLAAQGLAIGVLARTHRRRIGPLVAVSTREFLVGWRRACVAQLALIRGLAVVLVAEVVMLAAWTGLDLYSGGARILVREQWWYGALLGALAVAAWLGLTRSRTLVTLARIAAAQTDLDQPPAA